MNAKIDRICQQLQQLQKECDHHKQMLDQCNDLKKQLHQQIIDELDSKNTLKYTNDMYKLTRTTRRKLNVTDNKLLWEYLSERDSEEIATVRIPMSLYDTSIKVNAPIPGVQIESVPMLMVRSA